MTSPRFLDRSTPPHILTLILVTGISALTMNIFMPSLPSMARWFNVSYETMQLSVALYLGVSAALQIVVGPISDRFGRRAVLIWCFVLFLLATLGTLIAPTAGIFLFFRTAQAVVAAGMVLNRTIIRDQMDGALAASMIGYVTMGMSVVPMIGPMIGGYLDQVFGWQASFALLFVLGTATLVLVWFDLGETAVPQKMSLGVQIARYPQLLRSQRFWGYTLSAAFASGSFFAYLGGAPFVGSEIFGLGSATLGALFGLTAIGYSVGNFFAGRYSVRVGMNHMALAGAAFSVLGMGILALLTLAGLHNPYAFFGLTLLLGLGNGMTLPNTNAGMVSIAPELAGTASGLGGAMVIGGGAALSAIAGKLLGVGSSELPLVLLMLASATASMVSILWVMHRARVVGVTG